MLIICDIKRKVVYGNVSNKNSRWDMENWFSRKDIFEEMINLNHYPYGDIDAHNNVLTKVSLAIIG